MPLNWITARPPALSLYMYKSENGTFTHNQINYILLFEIIIIRITQYLKYYRFINDCVKYFYTATSIRLIESLYDISNRSLFAFL